MNEQEKQQQSEFYKNEPISFGRPRSFNDEKELRALIQEYFETWQHKGRPITLAGLCCYLGVVRSTFADYANGKYDSKINNFSNTIKEAREYIENDKLEKGLLGLYNPTIAIFDLKNNHGYTDKQDVTSDGKPVNNTFTLKISNE